jgi:transposase
MRRVREILRLKYECGASSRAIAVAVETARSTVRLCLDRVAAAGLTWPLPPSLTDQGLEALLFAPAGGTRPGARHKDEPDWTTIHRELRRPGVTLQLLWEEYRTLHPTGYGYSRWCELYRGWEGRLSPTMRQVHPAGERLFVDYAGHTVEVVDGGTGELRTVQVFVAVLGASNYTYAEASWTQTLPDWIGSHVRALEFLGGVPRQIVPDNLRAGVLRANWYEPGINPTYRDMAAHYGTAILPTRVRKPRDKAKVEVGVLVVERWILARLRNQRFFSLAELNAAIAALVTDLNARPMRKLAVSRRQLFEELDYPALSPLPAEPYIYAEWRIRRVSLDYHVVSTVITILYPTGCCASRSRPASPPAPLSCSTRVSGSPSISAAARADGTRRWPSTCRKPIDAMPSGRSNAFAKKPRRLAPRPRPSST